MKAVISVHSFAHWIVSTAWLPALPPPPPPPPLAMLPAAAPAVLLPPGRPQTLISSRVSRSANRRALPQK